MSFALGMLTPFAALFAWLLIFHSYRKIRDAIVYARPAHQHRRINIAARFVGARRGYTLGTGRLQLALIVGQRPDVEDQARSVLEDEFLPEPGGLARRCRHGEQMLNYCKPCAQENP